MARGNEARALAVMARLGSARAAELVASSGFEAFGWFAFRFRFFGGENTQLLGVFFLIFEIHTLCLVVFFRKEKARCQLFFWFLLGGWGLRKDQKGFKVVFLRKGKPETHSVLFLGGVGRERNTHIWGVLEMGYDPPLGWYV